MTKNGEDPLLPKDDNINELLEPPTEAEKNHAITGNFKNLLVVVSVYDIIFHVTY